MSNLVKQKRIRKEMRDYLDKQIEETKSFLAELPASPSKKDKETLESNFYNLIDTLGEIKKYDQKILDIMGDDASADLAKEISEICEFERRVKDTARKIADLAFKTEGQDHNSAGMQTRGKRCYNEEADGCHYKEELKKAAVDVLKSVASEVLVRYAVPAAIGYVKGKVFPEEVTERCIEAPYQDDTDDMPQPIIPLDIFQRTLPFTRESTEDRLEALLGRNTSPMLTLTSGDDGAVSLGWRIGKSFVLLKD